MVEDNNKKSILIVDDNLLIRCVIKDLIKDDYILAGEAVSGEQAVILYKELKPDLVIMDILMEGVNGIEAVKQIRTFDPEAKIIMLSSANDQVHVTESLKGGALQYFTKPINEQQLLAGVKKILSE
jgi:two-component system chemotaxis response regulator CheY